MLSATPVELELGGVYFLICGAVRKSDIATNHRSHAQEGAGWPLLSKSDVTGGLANVAIMQPLRKYDPAVRWADCWSHSHMHQ